MPTKIHEIAIDQSWVKQAGNQLLELYCGLLESPEIAYQGGLSLLLAGVHDHNLGITHNRAHRCLELLPNVGEKHAVESVTFVGQRRRLHDHPSIQRQSDYTRRAA